MALSMYLAKRDIKALWTVVCTESELTDSACRFRGIDQNSTKIWPIPHNYIEYIKGIGQWVPESFRGHYQEERHEQINKIHTFRRLNGIIFQNLRESPFRTVYGDYINHNLR